MAFEVTSYYELLALQKVFLEAKFSEEPEVNELIGSSFVGEMWLRVIRELQRIQLEKGMPNAVDGWEKWLREKITVGCREWNVALMRTKKEFTSLNWDADKKRKYVSEIFKPFILSENLISAFVQQVEAS